MAFSNSQKMKNLLDGVYFFKFILPTQDVYCSLDMCVSVGGCKNFVEKAEQDCWIHVLTWRLPVYLTGVRFSFYFVLNRSQIQPLFCT